MKKLLTIPFVLMLVILFTGCSKDYTYIEKYQPVNNERSSDAVDLDPVYGDILVEVYEADNLEKYDLYIEGDTVYTKYYFTSDATYQNMKKALTFTDVQLLYGRFSTVQAGTIGGFWKNVYPEDYKFWDNVSIELYIDGEQISYSRYKLDETDKIIDSVEKFNIDQMREVIEISDFNMSRYARLEKLKKDTKGMNFYRSITGHPLFIDIESSRMKSEKNVEKITTNILNQFNDMTEDEISLYRYGYPVIDINFRDETGIYKNITIKFEEEKYIETDLNWSEVDLYEIYKS